MFSRLRFKVFRCLEILVETSHYITTTTSILFLEQTRWGEDPGVITKPDCQSGLRTKLNLIWGWEVFSVFVCVMSCAGYTVLVTAGLPQTDWLLFWSTDSTVLSSLLYCTEFLSYTWCNMLNSSAFLSPWLLQFRVYCCLNCHTFIMFQVKLSQDDVSYSWP